MRRAVLTGAVFACGAALACSEPPSDGSGTGGSPASGGVSGAAGSANPSPKILSVLVSGKLDGEQASVKLTVDVTDPDGLSDIAGGKLYSQDKSKFLGAFTQLSAGTFAADLTWKALNDVEALVFKAGASTTRFVLVEFLDAASNSVSQEQALEVSCAACGPNCKACGKCTSGACTICEPKLTWSTCDLFCKSLGFQCTCAYQQCGDSVCAINGCADPCGATGCACDCG